jgi:hypothetical protein
MGNVAGYNNLPLTVGCRIKNAGGGASATLNKYVTNSNNGWAIDIAATSVNYIYSPNTITDRIIGGVGSIPSMNDGAWHFVIVEFIAANPGVNVYVNDALEGTSDWPTATKNPVSTTQGLTLGFYPGTSTYWTGEMDDAFIFDRLLTAAEKTLLFNDGVPFSPLFFSTGVAIG